MPTRSISIVVGLLIISLNTAFAQTPSPVLYSFCSASNCADGEQPTAGLIQDTAGNLYGTTYDGGTDILGGTVFKLTPKAGGGWAETVFYNFCSASNCADGEQPTAGLIQDAAGNFYGTTGMGGANCSQSRGCGTVFKLTAGGTLTTLYSFCAIASCADGGSPYAGLIFDAAGNLYGTTPYGGKNSGGVVFKLDTSGHETVLYAFCSASNCTDGAEPVAGLIQDTAGNLYGTTQYGGNNNSGTVFKLDKTGHETVLYNFCSASNCTDGQYPFAGVIKDAAGNLYGTTVSGGAANSGTVFKLDKTGHETVLYNFCSASNCADGAEPYAGLIQDAGGNLYGTTAYGGGLGGVVFNLTTKAGGGWTETTLYSFCSASNCTDGEEPFAGLILDPGGNLYGTTGGGGANAEGTVFVIPANGVDLSYPSGDVSTASWKKMFNAGKQFAAVGAWTGTRQNPYAKRQLLNAQHEHLATGAYAILNFLPNAKTGKAQIDEALEAVGTAFVGLKFIAVDVELFGNENSKNIIPIKKRIALINDAVNEIQNPPFNKKAIIYTDKKDWEAITGNCQNGVNTTCEKNLIALPLWDQEKVTFLGSDGKRYCGDGIPGLVPFKPYLYGWKTRMGNQYNFGIYKPGSDDSRMNARAMGYGDDDLSPGGSCTDNKLFNVKLDFDFFDPSLFQ